MAKPTRAKRGPKPKFLDVACPNPRCKRRGRMGLGTVVSNGTYRTRSTGKAQLFLWSRVTQFSLVVVIENSLPVPCMAGHAVASVPLRSPALIFSLSR
jgi:hypothetical protein